MSNLAQQALETSEGFMQALNVLQGKLLQFTAAERLPELRVLFADVKTRACQLKGYVAAGCVCAESPEPPTQPKRATTPVPVVPAFPNHPVTPPPPHIIEAANR